MTQTTYHDPAGLTGKAERFAEAMRIAGEQSRDECIALNGYEPALDMTPDRYLGESHSFGETVLRVAGLDSIRAMSGDDVCWLLDCWLDAFRNG